MRKKQKPRSKTSKAASGIFKLPAVTMHARYIFLDIVGFTHQRSVEAQADLVEALNRIVDNSLTMCSVKKTIVLPTGDGMCIAIESPEEMDIHLRVALRILGNLEDYNQKESDIARQFKLRIGANENDDNIVIDFNGKRNLAGAGINMAQRVMSTADANQLMVGQPVFEILRHREAYMHAFRSYRVVAKHGFELPVHQFILSSLGLNTDVPSQFKPAVSRDKRLPKLVAYYIALAISPASLLLAC